MKQVIKCQLGIAVFGSLVMAMVALQSPATAASPSTEFKKMFSRMDRQLCRSLSLANCKRQAAQKKTKPKLRKAPVQKSEKPKPPGPKQPPNLKPAKPAVEPTVQVEVKPPIPTPTLKPASLTREAIVPPIPTPVEKKPAVKVEPEKQVVILPAPVVPLPPVLPQAPHAMPDGTPTGEACFASLAQLGVKFTKPTTTVGTTLCTVTDAVQLQSMAINGEVVKFPDQPIFNCGFASTFAVWMSTEANPVVRAASQQSIASLGTGPGFQCRGRNGDSSAKLSEHAFGNAVDIERLKLANGETIEIKDAMTIGAKYQPVLATLRATSCQYFTTVLGPGANEAHATHFHLDLARRGKKGNFKMCQ